MKQKIYLSNFEDKNYQKCVEIRKRVFVEGQNVPLDLELDGDEQAFHFLIELDQIPVATSRYRPYKGTFKIERVATLENYRCRGLAQGLMLSMLEDIKDRYHSEFINKTAAPFPILHAQESVISFYQKRGWIPYSAPFLEADIRHQKMYFNLMNSLSLADQKDFGPTDYLDALELQDLSEVLKSSYLN